MSTMLNEVMALIAQEKRLSTVDIPIPSLKGKVVMRCAETLDLQALVKVANDHPGDGLFQACWVLADTCVGVFVDDPDGPVGFDQNGSPDPAQWPKLDRALAAMLPGLPDEPAAVEICQALFGAGYPPGSGRAHADVLMAQKAVFQLNQFDPKALTA